MQTHHGVSAPTPAPRHPAAHPIHPCLAYVCLASCSAWLARPLGASQLVVAGQAAAHLPELFEAMSMALPWAVQAASQQAADALP